MSVDRKLLNSTTPYRCDAAGPRAGKRGAEPKSLASANEARDLMMRRAQAASRSPRPAGGFRQDCRLPPRGERRFSGSSGDGGGRSRMRGPGGRQAEIAYRHQPPRGPFAGQR
jgi:hypothetical protein